MILPSYPFRVEIEILSKCNLNCVYCYAKPFSNTIPEKDNIEYVINKTNDEVKPFELILLGGEPFLRKDIFDVINIALNGNRRVGISTNGTLLFHLPEEKLKILRDLSSELKLTLQISIDSSNPIINDKTRGFGRATLKSMEVLEKNDIQFNIGIVITKNNYSDAINTIMEFARYKNLTEINLEPLQSTFLNQNTTSDLKVDDAEMTALYYDTSKKLKSVGSKIKINGVVQDCKAFENGTVTDTYGFKTCTAGLFRAGVFVNGDVSPCVTLRSTVLGNLHNESWKEIWKRATSRFLEINNSKDYENGRQCTAINLLRKETKRTKNTY